ncbi:uncharacterized protein LOC144580922 [Callithrix jacchus]
MAARRHHALPRPRPRPPELSLVSRVGFERSRRHYPMGGRDGRKAGNGAGPDVRADCCRRLRMLACDPEAVSMQGARRACCSVAQAGVRWHNHSSLQPRPPWDGRCHREKSALRQRLFEQRSFDFVDCRRAPLERCPALPEPPSYPSKRGTLHCHRTGLSFPTHAPAPLRGILNRCPNVGVERKLQLPRGRAAKDTGELRSESLVQPTVALVRLGLPLALPVPDVAAVRPSRKAAQLRAG